MVPLGYVARVRRRAVKLAAMLGLAALAALLAPVYAPAATVDAGSLRAKIGERSGFRLVNESGRTVLAEHAAARLGFRAGGVWHRATSTIAADSTRRSYTAQLATDDPAGRGIRVEIRRSAEGVISLAASVTGSGGPALDALGVGFEGRPGERYLGFGERSNALDQTGFAVENYVADGPYETDEYPIMEAVLPPWGFRPRPDATYYPIPWLLSTRGYGALVDSPETSYFHLHRSGAWSVELLSAPPEELAGTTAPPPGELRMRFFAGPRPADVLRRFVAETGSQPKPAAPWLLGPWVQVTGSGEEQLALLDELQAADAPLSVNQTYLHYLPCGDQRGRREAERARTAAVHERGLAITTYFNPMVCTGYDPVYEQAAASQGLLERQGGGPYTFRYSTATQFEVAEFDFTTEGGRAAFASVVGEAIEDGHDGWMEDFGEYTPLDSRAADGTPGTVLHNEYPRQYHCAAADAAAVADRPIVRFQRSGWTAAAPCADVVWGGDPSTAWGFDGLASAVRQALNLGLSGVGIWGSDIGGFFTIGSGERLTPELLTRWVQLGAVSPVMRNQTDGIALPEYARPQIWEQDQLANWRRYAKLHTQLYPYLVAAARQYRRSGLPLMRALALEFPRDPVAAGRDDEFLFGADLLAAPVLQPGATERSVYLPAGRWADLWRSVAYREGTGSLRLDKARLLRGAREVTLPAPLDELPLLVRAGAVVPLLPPAVDTLSDYPDPSTVSLGERRGRLRLLAFPRGDSSSRFYENGSLRSREGRNRWTLAVSGGGVRRFALEASLATLQRPLRPCEITVDGKPLPPHRWSVRGGGSVLAVDFGGPRARLVVRGC
jgi:sulfoquinovosidase